MRLLSVSWPQKPLGWWWLNPTTPQCGACGARDRARLVAEVFPLPCFPRWWVGEWQKCSATCGPSGLMKRTVLCIQSVGLDEQRALQHADCQHLSKPDATAPCHREVPCPSLWAVGNWSEVRSIGEVPQSWRVLGTKCPQELLSLPESDGRAPAYGEKSWVFLCGLTWEHQLAGMGTVWHGA